MNKIKAVIIEDEIQAVNILKELLNDVEQNIEVVGNAGTINNALELITEKRPQLVFFDIKLSDGYSFEIIDKLEYKDFHLIFVTAYSEFAIRAFNYAAIHYILKPISTSDLHEALLRYTQQNDGTSIGQLEILKDRIEGKSGRLYLKTNNGLELFNYHDIICFSAYGGYVLVCIKDGRQLVLHDTLNHFEELLYRESFHRIHAKHLVNMHHVVSISSKGRQGEVLLTNGQNLEISSRKKKGVIEALKKHK